MIDYIKSNEIKLITKKHTTWRKVFLKWLDHDADLHIGDLGDSFTILIENKHALSQNININYAYSLVENDGTKRGVIEKFNDQIQETLHQYKKDQFISSLKTQKYAHLFNDEVESIIHIILDNKVSIRVIKYQFFNKIARFKTSSDLLVSLSNFKKNNLIWTKEYFLNKIDQENLSVEVLAKENTLMIDVKNYKSCQEIGSPSWCIVNNIKTFNSYTKHLNRQYIYLNFDLPLEHNESMIGFTVDMNGSINSSYLKNDLATPEIIKKQFIFQNLSKKTIHKYLQSVSYQKAFLIICDQNLIDFYDVYISKPNVDPADDYNIALRSASSNGHVEIVRFLLKDNRVDPTANCDSAILYSSQNGHTEVVKVLLADHRVNPGDSDNCAIRRVSLYGFTEIFKLLLADKRVDPTASKNAAIICAATHGHIEIVKVLLTHDRVNPADNDNQAIRFAAKRGYLEIVKILLSDNRVDPSSDNNGAIQYASLNGHLEIVKILLSDNRVNPADNDNCAIRWASSEGHLDIITLLEDAIKERVYA